MTPADPNLNPIPQDPGAVLELEPQDLDGHTIEDLMDYLDTGRNPIDPAIESSPACRNALADLERLSTISASLLEADDDDDPADATWLDAVLARINLDAHAGRDFPIATDEHTTVVLTEGAFKALIRDAGDTVPGLLVGRVRYTTDLDLPGPITLTVEADIVEGFPIPDATDHLRTAIRETVQQHTRFTVEEIDITIRDLQLRRRPGNSIR